MFKGSMVALITPLKNNQVDVEKLRELVEYHIQSGTHGLVAAGSTGESGTLSHAEKLLVIKTVVEAAHERLPVIAGTASNATQDCIELTKEAMELGAHAALIMTPAYIRPTQEGLYVHYHQIAAAVPIPIILYNVPTRTGCDMQPETVARLSKISNIVGIKEAVPEMTRLQQLLRLCENSLDVFSGDDPTCAQWMLAGAKGVISVAANVVARKMAALCDLAMDNEISACLQLNQELTPLFEILSAESNPIPVKWAAYTLGLTGEEIRLPLLPLSSQYRESMEAILKKIL